MKVLNKILMLKITSIVRERISNTQKCVSETEGQIMARDRVLECVGNDCSGIIQFDFKNAFGTVSRRKIVERLMHYRIDSSVINYIIVLLNNQKIVYESEDGEHIMTVETGVPQGEPLSMILFALGIDELLQRYDGRDDIHVVAYADDIIIVVEDINRAIEIKDQFEVDAKEYGLNLNPQKTSLGYFGDLDEMFKSEIEQKFGRTVDLRSDKLIYVGLPITISNDAEDKFISDKIDEMVENTEKLWHLNIPIQVKYHLQRMCIDSKLDYYMKATQERKLADLKWVNTMQRRLDKAWNAITNVTSNEVRRLPTRYYGLGLMHIKDRWRVVRKLLNRKDSKEDPINSYYRDKTDIWVNKRRMEKLNLENLKKGANISIITPPNSNDLRLSDRAFISMIILRYNSTALNPDLKGLPLNKK